MSFREYLHEKAEESRHNETLAYLMFLAGTVIFIGGILETLTLAHDPTWFLIIPYTIEPHAGAVLGLTLVIGGIMLCVFGLSTGLYCSKDRSWYLKELRRANSIEETMINEKAIKNGRRKKKLNINPPKPS
jgi:hypothetical protein